jgi:hypothetical protein
MTIRTVKPILIALIILSCSGRKDQAQFENDLKSLDLTRGEIALCGAANGQFGTVEFSLSCSEKVRPDFNLATALLHSFEYVDAEKMFAKVIDTDPKCVMAYWGAAMSNFHPVWAPPNQVELQKGARIVALARSLIKDKSSKESDYLEAIATIYDQWETLDHHTRLIKFEKASERIFEKYPEDSEAAIFYALALRAAADRADKTFSNQKKAGQILNGIFTRLPNHPGVAHYIIHTYDYPELAELALPAARKYASIATASAHAQHMPSHIFTRLGLWDESIKSNLNSVSAAKCYAENMEMKGHWDEEIHGMDYLVYSYLQEANGDEARKQVEYFKTFNSVSPQNFKVAYSFAAIPTRYALELKNWTEAAKLELMPANFPWEKFPWERANVNFGRLLGAVHVHDLAAAKNELNQLQVIQTKLKESKENYKANLVLIQIRASEGWIKFAEGQKAEAITLMVEAADMEDLTEKDPVTPGEVIPARELLGDLYLEINDPAKALEAYELDLKRHPNRFNGLYGAGLAAQRSGNSKKAVLYYTQLIAMTNFSASNRPELSTARRAVTPNQ